MAKPTRWKDEYTLLCERCGYVVEGLDTAGPCPECGKPIAESLPERRIGTPWQQKPGVKSLMRTWWMTLRHPKKTLDVMSFSKQDEMMLTILTLILAFFLGICLAIIPYISSGFYAFLPIVLIAILFCGIACGLCFSFTLIEAFGLRIWGSLSGNRIDIQTTTVIVNHGAVGWLIPITSIGFGIFLYMYYPMKPIEPPYLSTHKDNELLVLIMWYTVSLSCITGFLYFEFFAYLGLRRCKYANRIRPEKISTDTTAQP